MRCYWYVRHGHQVHLPHFLQRAQQIGQLTDRENITLEEVRASLRQRIVQIDFQQAKEDVIRFVKQPQALDIWSQEYFLALADRLA